MWNSNLSGLSIPVLPCVGFPIVRQLSEKELMAEMSRRIANNSRLLTSSIAHKAAEGKRLVREKLSEEEAFAIIYVPFAIAEVAWDYIDTIFNFAQFLRLDDTKKLCRSIREIRREYNRSRFKIIDDGMRQSEIENAICFQEELKDFFGTLHRRFNDSMKRCYPELGYDNVIMLSAVYGCEIVLDALFRYVVVQERKVSQILGYEIASILPSELKALRSNVSKFYGRYAPSSFAFADNETLIEELVKHMEGITLNEI